ncbi:MAG: hypothetical protein AB7T49_15130 [Oligoflexales bacterium]
MRKASIISSIVAASFVASCSMHRHGDRAQIKEAWDSMNSPERFEVKTAKFSELPLAGEMPVERYPWSDDYWGTYAGGVARRWQNPNNSVDYNDHMYPLLTKEQIFDPSTDLSKLSPAEKYDILRGRYDLPLTKSQWKRVAAAANPATGKVPTWYGICHGWAPATIAEPEPGAEITMTNPDGAKVKFYTSDINALISLIYANEKHTHWLGNRCEISNNNLLRDDQGRIVFPACRDTNPAALHLVLANFFGNPDPTKRKSFVVDVSRDVEVWNQAATGYKVYSHEIVPFDPATDPAAQHRAPGTVSLVKVITELSYVGEIAPHKTPAMNRRGVYTKKMALQYTLELDANGVIIGGEWVSKKVPDFIWQVTKKPETNGRYLDYAIVSDLLQKSREAASGPAPSASESTPSPSSISTPVSTEPATPVQ